MTNLIRVQVKMCVITGKSALTHPVAKGVCTREGKCQFKIFFIHNIVTNKGATLMAMVLASTS